MGVGRLIEALPADERAAAVSGILEAAGAEGFRGFGGDCFGAAVAINRVLFDGKGELVIAVNELFWRHGRSIGHAAVRYGGAYWDADARPKPACEIESWGMLDHGDADYVAAAEALGETLDEESASGVGVFAFDDEEEFLGRFPGDKVEAMERALSSAAGAWFAAGSPRKGR
jgi:hypothetical protein